MAMELFLFPVYIGMYTCTDGDCGDSVTIAVAVSGTVSFVVTFLLNWRCGTTLYSGQTKTVSFHQYTNNILLSTQ